MFLLAPSVRSPVSTGLSNEHGSATLETTQETEAVHAQLLAVGVPSEPRRANAPQQPEMEDEDESDHEIQVSQVKPDAGMLPPQYDEIQSHVCA